METIEQFIKEMRDIDSRTIKVDSREPPEMVEMLEDVAPEYDMDVRIEVLDTGDYAFRNIGIERKDKDFIKVPDVLAKAEELKKGYDKAFVMTSMPLDEILEEDRRRHGGNWNESLKGLTASLVARGVEPIFCPSKSVFCEVLCKMFDKLTDAKDRNIEQPIRPKPTRKDWELYIISSLPDVGEITARKLLDHFDTVRGVFTASPEELMKVKGVGSKISNKIDDVLQGEEIDD